MENNLKLERTRSYKLSFIRFILFVVLPPLVVIPIINRTFKNPSEDDPNACLDAAINTDNDEQAKLAASKLIEMDPNNIKNHYYYIKACYESSQDESDKNKIIQEYRIRSENADPNMKDIGYFGLGYFYIKKKSYEQAIDSLESVTNRKLRYVNYFTGYAQEKLKDYEKAEEYFFKEIEYKGVFQSSIYRLGYMYLEQNNNVALEKLYNDQAKRIYIPNKALRKIYLQKLMIGHYLLASLEPVKENLNLIGFLGACLIVVAWLFFLKRLDLFEPEKNRYLIFTFIMSMILTIWLCDFLYDIFTFYLHFDLDDTFKGDLLYCIFGIGFIEELVKVIPLLIMIKFSRQVNESIDYIIYASVSALGFSFMENLLYFDQSSLFIIDERGIICVVGHMFYTSLIGYGIILAKYRNVGSVIKNGIIFFLIACTFHGLYDFVLINESIQKDIGFILFFVIFISEPILYNKIINNAINYSEFFNERVLYKLNHMFERLGFSLIVIVIFEYICLSWKYGPNMIYERYTKLFGFMIFLIYFLSFSLSFYIIKEKLWVGLLSRRKHQKGR